MTPTATLALVLAVASREAAVAAEAGEEWRIEASTDAACLRDFRTELLARTRTIRIDPRATRTLRLRLARKGGGYRGVLVVDRGPNATTRREVEGTRCEEVLTSLALVAALDIESPASPAPDAAATSSVRAGPSDAADAGEGDAGDSPKEGGVAAAFDAGESPKEGGVDAASDAGGSTRASPSPEPLAVPSRPSMGWGIHAEPETATFGGPLSLGLGGELVLVGGALLRLRGAGSFPDREEGTSGRSIVAFWRARAIPEVCPVVVNLSGSGPRARASVRPCVGAEVGVLSARGEGSGVTSTPKDTFWAAARLGARLDVRLGGPWLVGVASGLTLPFTREELVLVSTAGGPPELVYRAPPAAFFFGVSFGVRFR